MGLSRRTLAKIPALETYLRKDQTWKRTGQIPVPAVRSDILRKMLSYLVDTGKVETMLKMTTVTQFGLRRKLMFYRWKE